MHELTQKIFAEIEQINALSLRELCTFFLEAYERTWLTAGGEFGKERDRLCVAVLGALFCARGLCSTYAVTGHEKDLVLSACVCTKIAGEIGRVLKMGCLALLSGGDDGVARVMSIIAAVSESRGGTRRYAELLRGGERVEIMVALSFLLRTSIFGTLTWRRSVRQPAVRRRAGGDRKKFGKAAVSRAR